MNNTTDRILTRALRIPPLGLGGDLAVPDHASGLAIFAHVRTCELRFDIGMLAGRLVNAAEWAASDPETRNLRIGYFGASTGGGAALVAAAAHPERIGAVVSRGGRPDLAGNALPRVTAPTLLIAGGEDLPVIKLNEQALRQLQCEKRLEIVPGATHLFEEAGTLERVADLASAWFGRHLGPG